MTAAAGTDPATVYREIVVPVGVETAFATFTGRFGEIKPREHSLLGEPAESTEFGTAVGDGIVDRAGDASCRWGRILASDPPHRIVFSWDIAPTWELERDLTRCSEVEVRFTEVEPGRTRVEVEHRHLDRHGPGWEDFREQIFAPGGWPTWFANFRALFGEPAGAEV